MTDEERVKRAMKTGEPLVLFAPNENWRGPYIQKCLMIYGKPWAELFADDDRSGKYDDGKYYARTNGPGMDFLEEWASFGVNEPGSDTKGWWLDGRGKPDAVTRMLQGGWSFEYAIALQRLREDVETKIVDEEEYHRQRMAKWAEHLAAVNKLEEK